MSEASPWGMVIHYPNEHLIDLLNRGGVSWIRYSVPWSVVAPTGTPDWSSYGHTVMTAVRKRGMSVYLGLDLREPAWIDDNTLPPDKRAAAREESFERFVRSVMDYFGDERLHGASRVRYIHVGNEPNDPAFYPFGEDAYFDRLTRAIQIIRANDRGRGFKVCAPDLAAGRDYADSFLRRCLQRLRDHQVMIDVLSLHDYVGTTGQALDVMIRLSAYTLLLKELGLTLPIWLTETGVNMTADTGDNPTNIANTCKFVKNGFHVVFPGHQLDLKLDRVFWFVWSEDDGAAAGAEGKYSWLTSGLVPRPREWAAYLAATGESRPPVVPEYDATLTASSISVRAGEQRALVVHAVNVGRLPWDSRVRLENIDFDRLNAKLTPRSAALPPPLSVAPQAARDISIPVTAPSAAGTYRLRLQLTIGGEQFGGRAVVEVVVRDEPSDRR